MFDKIVEIVFLLDYRFMLIDLIWQRISDNVHRYKIILLVKRKVIMIIVERKIEILII